MPDIRLPVDGTIFALRAGILCIRDGKLLVVSGDGFDFRYLPGGAVAAGEDSAQAAAREWTEETGLPPGPLHLAGVIENFFTLNGQTCHEIGFFYRMDAPEHWPGTLTTLLDQNDQRLEWLPLAELDAARVSPTVIRELLNVPPGEVRHLVERR